MRFGDAVRHLRELAGESLDALAREAEIEREKLTRIEREEAAPDLDEIERIARALELQTWELVRFAELNMGARSRR